jgi:hypothetical protein
MTFPGFRSRYRWNNGIEPDNFIMDLVGSSGSKDKPPTGREKELQSEEHEEKFNVGFIGDDDIIQDQCKEKDGYPDEGDQHRLSEFPETRFPVYFPVGADKNVQRKPEERDHQDPQVEFGIQEYDVQVMKNLIIDGIFAEDEK